MIGDLVIHGFGHNGKVTAIDTNTLTVYDKGFDDGDGHCEVTFAWNEINPIPLTPEILEQNGLKIDKYKGGFFPACFKEDEHYDVEIEMKDEEIAWSINCGEYWIKRLNYVHELQHALRLFGIKKDIEL